MRGHESTPPPPPILFSLRETQLYVGQWTIIELCGLRGPRLSSCITSTAPTRVIGLAQSRFIFVNGEVVDTLLIPSALQLSRSDGNLTVTLVRRRVLLE